MLRRIICSTAAILLGIIVSPLLALVVGVAMAFVTFADFWVGLFNSLKSQPNTETPNQTKKETVWEKHMRLRGIQSDPDSEN